VWLVAGVRLFSVHGTGGLAWVRPETMGAYVVYKVLSSGAEKYEYEKQVND
jgi:hypothetical protein